jgi:hypothetical protein
MRRIFSDRSNAGCRSTCLAALLTQDPPALHLVQTAPDPVTLADIEGVVSTLSENGTPQADRLRHRLARILLPRLLEVARREEVHRVLAAARREELPVTGSGLEHHNLLFVTEGLEDPGVGQVHRNTTNS